METRMTWPMDGQLRPGIVTSIAMVASIALTLTIVAGCASSHAGSADQGPGSSRGTEKSKQSLANQTSGSTSDSSGNLPAAIEVARDRVFPALVNISVISVSFWEGKETKGGSTGSGTIISPDGLIVTNHHVVDDGRTFKVTLADKREITATLVGEDPMTDLAVLRLNLQALNGQTTLPVAKFGDSDSLAVGDYVLAMGAPYGLNRSVTLGVVSNTERVFTGFGGDDIQDQEFDFDRSSDIFTRWLQHDALILPGNSGGPLVNLRGEIVGINTRGGNGLGFANPSNFAKSIVDEIIAHGEVTRSTIGANFKSVKKTGIEQGVLINSVNDEGSAANAGLKAGDVITAIDGKAVSARFPEEIPLVLREIADKPVGTPINLSYLRDGQTGSATATTEKLLREKGKEFALRMFGISISEITDKMARNRNLQSKQGAIVIGIRGGGPAQIAEPAITYGDVVKSINGVTIASEQDALNAYRTIVSQEPIPEFVVVEFDRNGKSNLTLLKPRPEKPDDPPRELPKAWIGIATQPVLKQLADQLKDKGTLGFRVTRIYPNTLAAQSGLIVGDIITKLNGEALSPRSIQDSGMFQRQVRRLSAGGMAKLAILRDGTAKDLDITLERTRITAEEALRDSNRDFELTVRELTFFDRDDNRWAESVQGVIVQSVERAGWAGLAGVFEGDLIQRINNYTITDLASYRKAMEAIAKEQPARVSFFVLRGPRTQFKFAEPDWKPTVAATK